MLLVVGLEVLTIVTILDRTASKSVISQSFVQVSRQSLGVDSYWAMIPLFFKVDV